MTEREMSDPRNNLIVTPGLPRRQFVRTMSGLFVANSVAGCSGDLPSGVELGTIVMSIFGITDGGPGGQVDALALTGEWAGEPARSFDIDSSLTRSEEVPVGDYELTYFAPQGWQLPAGAQSTFTETVTADATTSVDITVEATPTPQGTLDIQVTGLSPTAGGGSVLVTGNSVPGYTPTTYAVNNNSGTGTRSIVLDVGSYNVQYTAPNSHTVNTTNPVNNVSITQNQTSMVSFGVTFNGGGGGAADIYEHTFEDGTAGQFKLGNGQSPITGRWSLDTTTAARGSNSLKQIYQVSSGNTGEAFFYTFGTPVLEFWVRYAYRQSSPFNSNNQDFVKMNRCLRPNFQDQFASFGIAPGGRFIIGWDAYDSANFHGIQFSPVNANDFIGQWFWIEIYRQMIPPNTGTMRVWIDGTLAIERTYNDLRIPTNAVVGLNQFDGTVNSVTQISTAWMDHIGIGTQQMGIP